MCQVSHCGKESLCYFMKIVDVVFNVKLLFQLDKILTGHPTNHNSSTTNYIKSPIVQIMNTL